MEGQPIQIAAAVLAQIVEGDGVALCGRYRQTVLPRLQLTAGIEGRVAACRVASSACDLVLGNRKREPRLAFAIQIQQYGEETRCVLVRVVMQVEDTTSPSYLST